MPSMRFLLCPIDAIGDLVVTLPVQMCILDNDPSAEIFWLVRPDYAPILDRFPSTTGVLRRLPGVGHEQLLDEAKPDVLLNFNYRDRRMVPTAKRLGVPIRIARPRDIRQALCATHLIWGRRTGSGRHEAQNALDFLKPFKWPVPAQPPLPRLSLTPEEAAGGEADLRIAPRPRLGLIVRGQGGGAGAFPGEAWWKKMLRDSESAGWSPAVLSPPDAVRCGPGTPDAVRCGTGTPDAVRCGTDTPNAGALPPTSIRGLMARLRACDAVLGISTGPTHLAAALGVPTLCLMGKRVNHGPDRWKPLGERVETMQYPGEEDDLGSGMNRLDTGAVLAGLERLR
jgi:ADP-heptose:LPS heptosyltransferase